jgi:hypothetical protein
MLFLRIFLHFIVAILLTLFTQVGGIIYLISLFSHKSIEKRLSRWWARVGLKFSLFAVLYLVSTFILIPLVAKSFGRVQLPLLNTRHVQPGNILTFLMNRNYVRPELRNAIFDVGDVMNEKYPGVVINYLDASFPFVDGFPLPPHLSHSDGKKVDISFIYVDKSTSKRTNKIPSFIGYGICEGPKDNEENMPDICDKKGYWQYNLLPKLVSQESKSQFEFASEEVTVLVNSLSDQLEIKKIFIEPHLKTRLKLKSNKIRFHGCQAVRHDDHIHVQLK